MKRLKNYIIIILYINFKLRAIIKVDIYTIKTVFVHVLIEKI